MDFGIRKAPRSNLLMLRGVSLDDLIAPIKSSKPITDTLQYASIPKKFIDVESWPKTTNLLCWICDTVPNSYPAFVPMNPEINGDGKETCDPLGNFCNWNHAIEYVDNKYHNNPELLWDLHDQIYRFEEKFSGIRKEKIPHLAPKTEMKKYCGNSGLTLQQWHDKNTNISRELTIHCGRKKL